jgi:hypothetical protein
MLEKFVFTKKQVNKYFNAACRDLSIASRSNVPEIVFTFCYEALIKLAIAVCAKNGWRVKPKQGYHFELIHKLAVLLGDDKDQDIEVIGNEMRSKRNLDLYSGGAIVSLKETDEYRQWLKKLFKKVELIINS